MHRSAIVEPTKARTHTHRQKATDDDDRR